MVYDSRIDDAIDYYGTTVTVSAVGTEYKDDWGNTTYDSSSSTITTVLNDITGDEEWNTEGLYVRGDKLLFLKSSDDLHINDIITISGDTDTYRVTQKPIRHNVMNESQQKEVPVKRV